LDGQGVHLGQWCGGRAVVRVAHVVVRVPVLHHRGPAGHHLGQLVDHLLGLAPLDHLEQVGVAVEVVEVLQHPELVRLLQVRVRFHPRHPRGEVHGDLLVRDRGLQRAGDPREQPVDHPLLLRLQVAQQGELPARVRVGALPRQVVVEEDRLGLDAVHGDHPATGVGGGLVRVGGAHVELTPVADLVVERDALVFQGVEHDAALPTRGRLGACLTACQHVTPGLLWFAPFIGNARQPTTRTPPPPYAPEPRPRPARQTGMRRAAAAAVAVAAGTVLFMISACGGGGEPGGDGAAPAGRGTPADHATGPPPTEGAGGPGTNGGADATPPPRPDPDDPTTPLDGTRWTVDTVIVDGATLAVPAGPSGSAWLTIEGARFRAVTGCGEVEGR